MSAYPYQDRFPVSRTLPEHGRPREEILKLREASRYHSGDVYDGKA